MRSDYGLYGVAIICFLIAGVFAVAQVPGYTIDETLGKAVITIFMLFGIISAAVGYSARPKAIIPATQPTPPPTTPAPVTLPPEMPPKETLAAPTPPPTEEAAPEPLPPPPSAAEPSQPVITVPEESEQPAKVAEEEKPKPVRRRRKKTQ